MIIKNEQITLLSDAEIANRRLKVVAGYIDRLRRERDALLVQNRVLKSSNEGLVAYIDNIHFDEAKEAENIEEAASLAIEDEVSIEAASEYDQLETFDIPDVDPDSF